MTNALRFEAAKVFVETTDWAGAPLEFLAGDASNRRYYRLARTNGAQAVLMDAPPEKGEDTRPFIAIAHHLRDHGLSAPDIYAMDIENGFLLIEDLGDAIFARVLERDAALGKTLYVAAVEALAVLAKAPLPSGIDAYDPATMGPLAGLAGSWYAGDPSAAKAISDASRTALNALPAAAETLVLRDFHAENLIWLPDRDGTARVGLLDFQDARVGHPAYDVASLIRDARREVQEQTQQATAAHFAQLHGLTIKNAEHALCAQGAQRNLRILGVFARLSLHFGKPHYIDMIPRVWRNLQIELAHPALHDLRSVALETLPEPSPQHLQDLKDRCGTRPTLA